jgi:predicted  nucleic acid-binding Zn-ribbon protein
VTTTVVVVSLALAGGIGCGKKNVESAYGPGADWIEDMRERIRDDIKDQDKATKLLAQVDAIESVLVDLDRELLVYYGRVSNLSKNYDSTREDFQKEIDSFNDYRRVRVEELLRIFVKMKTISGRADWEIVSNMDHTLYESWQRNYNP